MARFVQAVQFDFSEIGPVRASLAWAKECAVDEDDLLDFLLEIEHNLGRLVSLPTLLAALPASVRGMRQVLSEGEERRFSPELLEQLRSGCQLARAIAVCEQVLQGIQPRG